jgi:hypothetical protein
MADKISFPPLCIFIYLTNINPFTAMRTETLKSTVEGEQADVAVDTAFESRTH